LRLTFDLNLDDFLLKIGFIRELLFLSFIMNCREEELKDYF